MSNKKVLYISSMDCTRRHAVALLKKHEGVKLKMYYCPAGKPTIGVGRNLEDRGITEKEAMLMLNNDIQVFSEMLGKRYFWFNDLDDIRKAVIIDMAFNMGLGDFHLFKKTRGFLAKQQHHQAAEEMLDSDWARNDVPSRAKELSNIMRSGRID